MPKLISATTFRARAQETVWIQCPEGTSPDLFYRELERNYPKAADWKMDPPQLLTAEVPGKSAVLAAIMTRTRTSTWMG